LDDQLSVVLCALELRSAGDAEIEHVADGGGPPPPKPGELRTTVGIGIGTDSAEEVTTVFVAV
jgi:hypothetical protein